MNDDSQRETLSASEAAAMLNLSRAQLILLLEKGRIQSTRVARHFRVDANDLHRYRQERLLSRAAFLDELAVADAEYLG